MLWRRLAAGVIATLSMDLLSVVAARQIGRASCRERVLYTV